MVDYTRQCTHTHVHAQNYVHVLFIVKILYMYVPVHSTCTYVHNNITLCILLYGFTSPCMLIKSQFNIMHTHA